MIEEIREKVISAFRPEDEYAFSNEIPFRYNNFIDGQAWVGMLAGAARLAGDSIVESLASKYLTGLSVVGKDARTFAPYKVSGSWLESTAIYFKGYYYKQKPQGFAGPCAIRWAEKLGVYIWPDKKYDYVKYIAMAMVIIAPLFGYLIRFIPYLRQHINSIMFAHFLLGKKPPKSMMFLAKDNMVYSYLYRLPCDTLYENTGIWPAKDYPGESEIRIDKEYTPICNLVGLYLQQALKKGIT